MWVIVITNWLYAKNCRLQNKYIIIWLLTIIEINEKREIKIQPLKKTKKKVYVPRWKKVNQWYNFNYCYNLKAYVVEWTACKIL